MIIARPARGFSLSPLVVIIALALIGLITWKVAILQGMDTRNFFIKEHVSKHTTYSILWAFVIVAIAGGFGAFANFLFQKSEAAINTAMALPLLAGVGIFGYQVYNYYTRSPSPNPAAATVATAPAPTDNSTPAPTTKRLAPPATLTPSRPRPSRQPITFATPPSLNPLAPTGAAPPAPTTAALPAGAQQALDAFIADLKAQRTTLADKAEALMDVVKSVPRPIRAELDKRRDAAKAINEAADKLHDRLMHATREAQEKLEAAGVSIHDAMPAAVRATSGADSGRQISSCFQLKNFADGVLEEANLLTDALGKWTYKDGKVNTSDATLRMNLNSPRFRVDNALRRRADLLDPLRAP